MRTQTKFRSKNYIVTIDPTSDKDLQFLKEIKDILRAYNKQNGTTYYMNLKGTNPIKKRVTPSPYTGALKERGYTYHIKQGNIIGGGKNANEFHVYVYEMKAKSQKRK